MKEILVTRSSMPPLDEYVQEIKELWESHWLTNMGVKHEELRRRLKEYLGVANMELTTNGHMALELTIQAMGFPRGSEVITTPFTFASTTHAIVRNGLIPVFCDINPDDFTIDASKIEALITEKTCAIVPVHVYGNVCAVEEIEAIAKKNNLKVIYDAAHAFGEYYKGRGIGIWGEASCFSFHATKVFNTIEGGGVAFKDKELGKALYYLKNFGILNEEVIESVGANAKMNEFQAAMGICNLRYIDREIDKRKRADERYRNNLRNVPGIRLNSIQEHLRSNYSYFPIVVNEKEYGIDRDNLYLKLIDYGIKTRKYFYPLTNTFSCFHGEYDATLTPVALRISKQVLTLPLYADIELEEIDRISEILYNFGEK